MKRMLLIGYLLCSVSLVFASAQSWSAVQNQYKFKFLTVDQGLSHNNIRSICQDAQGFIWIATQNGVNKFDGQTTVTYWNNPFDSSTISSNFIFSIFLDSKDKLWIGSLGGLDIYNSDFNNFTRFSHNDIEGPLGNVEALVEDQDGKLWIGAETGLYSYNLHTTEIEFFSNKKGNPYGIPTGQIYRLLVDANNKIWISIINEGLCVYNQDDSLFTCFKSDPDDPSTISSDRIECLYEDKNGKIWAGTLNDGLNCYVSETNSFLRIIPDPSNSYSTRVRAMFEDLRGNFYIGTRVGLYVRNDLTKEFVPYAHEGHYFSSLSQNSIQCSVIDKSGTLWIGTFSGGVNYTNLNRKEFIYYPAGKNDNHFLSGANIYCITEDPKGNLWVGGDNGLDYLDRATHTFKYYFHNPNDPYSISYNDIKSFEWDKKGNLWVGTNNGGLNYYNVETGKFKSYRHNSDDPNSIAGDKIYCLMNDKEDNLWIILSPYNDFDSLYVDILPDGSDKFVHLNETSYFGFDQSENGDVYIGGVEGFWIFSSKDSIYKFISNEKYIGNVQTIRKDSKDHLWIGSSKGLVRYSEKDQSFVWFSVENGYPISDVFGILEDDTKSLWVSTNTGLVKISNIVEDTANIKFRVFDNDDGLQSKQFNYNAFYKSESGEMAFGGINGFNTFFPNKIIEDSVPPNVILTDLKIFNSTVPIGEKVGDQIILKKSISVTEEITLGPNHNVFTLEFAALHNANPEKNLFKYKLEGLDMDWQYRKAGNNFVTYTNLSAGEYTFMVTAANNDGVWSKEPVKLKIIVVPPYWKTWWFSILAVLAIIAIIVGIYYYRLRSIQHQNKLLEEALSKAKESDELKSAFLANMSHEIRTPMNAITGFSGLLNESGLSSDERAEYTHIIQSNSKGLLKIIDEILDLSLIESNQLKLTEETFDLNVIIDHIYSYYYLNNSSTKVVVRKNNTLQSLNLKLSSDSVRIKQVVINLMDNASKFTEIGFIELGVHMDKDNLCIYVEDTGRGIPSKSIDQIFQQFTKLEDDESAWTRGLGLGLAISQRIADALGGKILVKSAEGKGSIFTFSIPVSNVITEEEIIVSEFREPIPARWHGKTILIAEDVEANYLYLEKVLKKTQTDIIWAKNGEEAVKVATASSKIDLILMDIKMPKMNGYDAAKKIKEHNPDQIIIAQTAYARPGEKLKFYDKHFDEYLSKPIASTDLLIILEQFL